GKAWAPCTVGVGVRRGRDGGSGRRGKVGPALSRPPPPESGGTVRTAAMIARRGAVLKGQPGKSAGWRGRSRPVAADRHERVDGPGKTFVLLPKGRAEAQAGVLAFEPRVAEGEVVLGGGVEAGHRLGDVEVGVHLPAVDDLPELVVPALVVEVDRQPGDEGAD